MNNNQNQSTIKINPINISASALSSDLASKLTCIENDVHSNFFSRLDNNLKIIGDDFKEGVLTLDPITLKSSITNMELFSRLEVLEEIVCSKLGVSKEYIDTQSNIVYEKNKQFYKELVESLKVADKLSNSK